MSGIRPAAAPEGLVQRCFDGSLSGEEGGRLNAWLAADPSHLDEFVLQLEVHAGLWERTICLKAGIGTGAGGTTPERGAWRRAAPVLVAAAAAAAVLLAAAGLGAFLLLRSGRPDPEARQFVRETLPGGTTLTYVLGTRMRRFGTVDDVDEVIRLDAGEVCVEAAAARSGRRAVRIDTPVGMIETLGTVFTAKVDVNADCGKGSGDGKGEEGGGFVKTSNRTVLLAGMVTLLVSVDAGAVLLRGDFGAAEVCAGESATVVQRGIGGTVTDVKMSDPDAQVHTSCTVTVALKGEGVRPGFVFDCQEGRWSGTVTEAAEGRAVLRVALVPGGARPKAGDAVSTRFTEVAAGATVQPSAAGQPELPAGDRQTVNGLQLTLFMKRLAPKDGAGAEDKAQRMVITGIVPGSGAIKRTEMDGKISWVIKNVGDAPIVLPGSAWAISPFLSVRDKDGRAVAAKRQARAQGQAADAPEKPLSFTVVKPGQTLERPFALQDLAMNETGVYAYTAQFEVAEQPEPLPGVKVWSGKLVSNEVRMDISVSQQDKQPRKGPQPEKF